MSLHVFEGINGSGKTTVIAAVAKRLRERDGEDSVVTLFNPTQGPVGMELRRFLSLRKEKGFPGFFTQDPETESFARQMAVLFAADRIMQQEELLQARAASKTVLLDRYALSTLVYQCAMIGDIHYESPLAKLIGEMHERIVIPDMTIVFDLPPEAARARLSSRGERLDDRLMASIEPAARAMYRDIREVAARRGDLVPLGTVRILNADRPIEDVIEGAVELVSEPAF